MKPTSSPPRSATRAAAAAFAALAALASAAAVTQAQAPGTPPVERPEPPPAATRPAEAPRVIYVPMEQPGIGRSGAPFGMMSLPPDVVQHVSAVLQVDGAAPGDDAYGRGDLAGSAAALLTSTALIDGAVAATLKIPPELRRQVVIVNASAVGGRKTRLEVALRKHDAVKLTPTAANDLLAAMCERLKAAMEESSRAARDVQQARDKELQRQLDEARARLQDVRNKTRAFRDTFSQLPGDFGNTDPQFAIRNIRQQHKQVEAELTRSRARLAALEPAASGPLASEWDAVVKLREQRVAELKKAAGGVESNAAELRAAEDKLAEARAQLATAQRAATGTADPNRSVRYNESSQLRASVAEQEARLKPLADALAKLEDPKIAELAEQMPELQQQEQRARNEITELQNRIDSARRQAQSEPIVVVTVLDGEPDKR